MYTIRLQNCAFFARHGVLEEEKRLGQRFFVDAAMQVDAAEALRDDTVENTVHYGEAFELIRKIVEGQRFKLIEALALTLCKALTERFPAIRRVEITVRKPSAPIAGVLDHAEVTVAWPE